MHITEGGGGQMLRGCQKHSYLYIIIIVPYNLRVLNDFIEGPEFSWSYDLAPWPPPSPASKLFLFLNLLVCKTVELTDGRGDGVGGSQAIRPRNAWTSINHQYSLLTPHSYFTAVSMSAI